MGLADRDYMRERYAKRQGLGWNERKARVQYDEYDRGPARYPRSRGNSQGQSAALLFLCACLLFVVLWWSASSWLKNNFRTFPPSGSVTVSEILRPGTASSRLRIKTGRRQAVVQILTPDTGNHVMSIFMQPRQQRDVPVPPGTWRMRVIKGEQWRGPHGLFGKTTEIFQLPASFEFSAHSVRTLDLTRDPPPSPEIHE